MMNEILINPEIKKYPSVYQALLANTSAIENLDKEKEVLEIKLAEEQRKIEICKKLKMPTKSLMNTFGKMQKQLKFMGKQRKAYESGYLEVPRLQRNPETVEFNNQKWWGFRFNKDVPLRVLEALDKAKEAGIFDDFVVFRQARTIDPIMAGRIGNRYFFLASWR